MPDEPVLDGDIIETDIDRLFKLVKKRKVMKLAEAASELGKKKADISEWGSILEDHKLVELHYPIMGEPEIRYVEKKKRDVFAEKEWRKPNEEEEEKKPRKPLPVNRIVGYGIFFVTLAFTAYIYYAETLYTMNVRARINQYLFVSRDFVTSMVPALDNVFLTMDSIFRGQFYLVLFPIIIIGLVAYMLSKKPGPPEHEAKKEPEKKTEVPKKEKPKEEPKDSKEKEEKPEKEPRSPGKEEPKEKKADEPPEGNEPETPKGLPSILKALRRF